MKRTLFYSLLMMAALSACGLTGYGPAVTSLEPMNQADITPRTKGGTLNITPSSKGGTLLKGAVIWPAEVAALARPVFDLKVYAGETLLAQGQTNEEAGFVVQNAPLNTLLRVEAAVPGRPFVVLRSLVTTSEQANQQQLLDISMLTTAAAAVLAEPGNLTASPERLMQADAISLLTPLANLMTPYLEQTQLSRSIEAQSSVQLAITDTRSSLARLLSNN